jgi:sugar lactone lactonase YvrE
VSNRVEVLASGLGLLESPRFADNTVYFADWSAGDLLRFDLSSGDLITTAHVGSLPLCFDLAGDELRVLDSAKGMLVNVSADGASTTVADVSALSRGGGNEVLVTPERTFLNFGNFNPAEGFPTESVGLIAVVDNDGRATVVADSLAFPNGMALSAHRTELIVAESYASRLTAWTIQDDGTLTDRRTWAQLDGAAPDGISMAPDGTCWYADVSRREVVRVGEGGAVIDRIALDRGAFSCVFAAESNTLFVTAAHWPGGQRMFDPTHLWDGQLLAIALD